MAFYDYRSGLGYYADSISSIYNEIYNMIEKKGTNIPPLN